MTAANLKTRWWSTSRPPNALRSPRSDPDLLELDGERAVWLRELFRFRAGWEVAEENRQGQDTQAEDDR